MGRLHDSTCCYLDADGNLRCRILEAQAAPFGWSAAPPALVLDRTAYRRVAPAPALAAGEAPPETPDDVEGA